MTIQQQYQQTKVLTGPQNSMPVIAGVEITTDEAGRFNLNALHRASGAGDHKAPNQWMRTKQAKELISELTNQTANSQSGHEVLKVINGGVAPGTFAHELLAISYASWIRPAFHLQVNQVFLDYRTGKLTPQPTKEVSRKELAIMVLQAEEENERLLAVNQVLESQLEETKPVIDAFVRIADADGSLNVTEAAKALQVGRDYLFNYLSSQRWIYKRAGSRIWLGYQERVQQGFLTHKVTTQVMPNGVEAIREQVRITPKGLAKLAKLLGVMA
ncbi:phage antirepressor KilAC domain-containing protein [Aeromonas hydrophila]|uniref:phage antirepressor KilAC domain-containing protein n=1 Tax=Aeromonas hydrophila TaxID=644 RepID=UPI003987F198